MLKDKNILIGISGGIAAYKILELISLLKKRQANVKVILTQNAKEFVTKTSIAALSDNQVFCEHFPTEKIEHITLADWADIFVIAPATANIIGKMASGIADDLLTTTILATTSTKLIVPAMNVNMYENLIVQHNLQKLENYGFRIMEPDTGKLACGYSGKGRLPKPAEILQFINGLIYNPKKDLLKKKILITAGATIEEIDPMRYITNYSSGKMGIAMARAAFIRGADVTLIFANIKEEIPYYLNSIKVKSAEEMYKNVIELYENKDIIIKAAAVSDFTPHKKEKNKIKKSDRMLLELIKTKDILLELGKRKHKQILVGFAAESENIVEFAKEKLKKKNLDFIVANNLSVAGKEETEIFLIDKNETITKIEGSKFLVANKILDILANE